jgi:CRP-like cAMP-binding protein
MISNLFIKEFKKYSNTFNAKLENLFEFKQISRGDHLYKQGDICRHLYYIKNGIARTYYFSEKGKEITLWFSIENTFITASDSFFLESPTRNYCEALEDMSVYLITYANLESVLSDKDGAHVAFFIMYQVARKLSEVAETVRTKSARERYKFLLTKYPSLIQRVPLGQLASFLGISQETLSRIRGKI